MSKLIRYTGDQKRTEVSITGRGKTWWPGELRMVSDAIASALLLSGGAWEIERGSDAEDELNEVTASTDAVTGVVSLSAGGASIPLSQRSAGYHFHGFAPNQINSDLKFYDYSGALNDGAFQTNLTAANAWATAGVLTQANPSAASELSLIAIPPISFDWANGDSLFIFWRGKATPEAGDSPLLADTSGTAANGIKLNVSAAGKMKFNCYQASGTLSRFGGTTTSTAFETTVAHSVAVAVDGVTGKHCMWVDGVRDATFSAGFGTFSGGVAVDTLNATTLKLGGDGSTATSIQNGVFCQHQALVILRGRRGIGTPLVADMDILVANLHRNPQALVSDGSW